MLLVHEQAGVHSSPKINGEAFLHLVLQGLLPFPYWSITFPTFHYAIQFQSNPVLLRKSVSKTNVQTFSQNMILLSSYVYNFCSPHFTSAFPVALQNGRDDHFLWSIWFGGEIKPSLSPSLCGGKNPTNKQWNGLCAHYSKPSHLQ